MNKTDSENVKYPHAGLSPAVKILLTVPRRYFISVMSLLCFCARLFIDAFWSPAGNGLTSWLSFVMSYCELVTF